MTVTLTYDNTNARISIAATGLTSASNYATIERSIDQIVWTTCRGGLNVPTTAGALTSTFYDYEFTDGVPNYYRVRGVDSDPITFVNDGATASDANAAGTSTLSPAIPATLTVGDLMLMRISIRNSGAGTPNTPTGWTRLVDASNFVLFGRLYQAGDAAPTVSFTGGVANATLEGKIMAWRNAALTPLTSASQLNGSAQNVAYPALTIPSAGALVLALGWRQGSATSSSTIAGFTSRQDVAVALGGTVHAISQYQIQTTAVNIAAGSFTITGGSAAISRGMLAAFGVAPFLNEQINNVTPALTAEWLKSPTRPFLNVKVTVADPGNNGRADRGGEFDVAGRTLAIATTDVRSGQAFPLVLYTATVNDAKAIDFLLASGDVLFVHVRAAKDWAGGYVRVAGSGAARLNIHVVERWWTLQCTQVAAPGPDMVYALSTWASVLALYPTWADVLAANPTWADLLARIGSPSEVIVP